MRRYPHSLPIVWIECHVVSRLCVDEAASTTGGGACVRCEARGDGSMTPFSFSFSFSFSFAFAFSFSFFFFSFFFD